MTNPKGKLVVVPEGWVVVPIESTFNMRQASAEAYTVDGKYKKMIKAAPPLPDTPPVLRWEGNGSYLYLYDAYLGIVWETREGFMYSVIDDVGLLESEGCKKTEQEARRAAEKALGFPDGLIVD